MDETFSYILTHGRVTAEQIAQGIGLDQADVVQAIKALYERGAIWQADKQDGVPLYVAVVKGIQG